MRYFITFQSQNYIFPTLYPNIIVQKCTFFAFFAYFLRFAPHHDIKTDSTTKKNNAEETKRLQQVQALSMPLFAAFIQR